MKFADLHPRFIAQKSETPTADGAGGVLYTCPCGGHETVIPFENPLNGPRLDGYDIGWQRSGATVEDLTLSPSIASKSGPELKDCAHYFIRKGEVVTA